MAAGQPGAPGANVMVKLAESEKDIDEENAIILRKYNKTFQCFRYDLLIFYEVFLYFSVLTKFFVKTVCFWHF